ncbi:MAG: hypothetical protein ABIW76_14370 [Fibrobacteria bacterium]
MDYDAVLVDPAPNLSYSVSDVVSAIGFDSVAFEIEPPELHYAGSDVAAAGGGDTAAYEIETPKIRYANSGVAVVGGADSRAYEIGILIMGGTSHDGLPSSDSPAFLIGFDPEFHPPLIGDLTMVEVIYPVVPVSEANKVLTRLDSEEIRVTLKGPALVTKDTDTIHFRVNTSYVATFLSNLDTNRLDEFRLETPGYTPFGGTSEDNFVRVMSRGRPQREDRGLTQLIPVTFRFMAEV